MFLTTAQATKWAPDLFLHVVSWCQVSWSAGCWPVQQSETEAAYLPPQAVPLGFGRNYVNTGADCVHSDQKCEFWCPTWWLELGETVLLIVSTTWRSSSKGILCQQQSTVDSILRFFPPVHLSHLQKCCGLTWPKGGTHLGGDYSMVRNSGEYRKQKQGREAVQRCMRDHPLALVTKTSC